MHRRETAGCFHSDPMQPHGTGRCRQDQFEPVTQIKTPQGCHLPRTPSLAQPRRTGRLTTDGGLATWVCLFPPQTESSSVALPKNSMSTINNGNNKKSKFRRTSMFDGNPQPKINSCTILNPMKKMKNRCQVSGVTCQV